MDDLLQRLLAVDRQGDSSVKEAEEKAISLREAAAARLAALNAEFAKSLASECAAIEASAVTEAENRRASELSAARKELAARRARLAKALAPWKARFLEELLGLDEGQA